LLKSDCNFDGETIMKTTKLLLLTMLAMFLVPSSVHAACTNHTGAGKWGFSTTGSIPAIGAVAATGVFTQDASGNITGTQTRSLNGDIADETFTGTATVNPDCTGTDTIQVFESGILVRTTTLHVVYDDNGQEARAVFTSLVLPDGTSLPSIITIEARRLFRRESD
jgi:hypothetical protein